MPRIGLISDSHGRAKTTRQAVARLIEHEVELLLHLGDVGSYEVIDALAVNHPHQDNQIEARLVFGNTDWDIADMTHYARGLGIQVDHPAGNLQWGDTKLVYCHGHQQHIINKAIQGNVHYLCHGHTHIASDITEDNTRIINPGALFRARFYSVALLDTEHDNLIFFTLTQN